MSAFNQAAIDVCKEQDIACVDAAAALPRDATSFFDDVHLTDVGCDKLADLLCNYFAAKLLESKHN